MCSGLKITQVSYCSLWGLKLSFTVYTWLTRLPDDLPTSQLADWTIHRLVHLLTADLDWPQVVLLANFPVTYSTAGYIHRLWSSAHKCLGLIRRAALYPMLL